MEPAERDERIGSIVEGRYRILESMAAGSMGVVYRAERVPVGKPVAIKFLHSAFAGDPEFLSRFERETRVMSKLTHPHCVSVVDFGISQGEPYIVMDFVGGTTLRDILDEHGPMDVSHALGLLRQILAGLAHAHEQGIVHRDIKPANVMITEEIGTGQHVRILDFGLARLRGTLGANATQTHVVVGTPSYMAPEQTVGAAVDARADLYSAGIVLFEMLTGEKPFASDSTLDLMAMHRGAPVPRLSNTAPIGMAIPDGVQALVDRALAKEPQDRYQSAIEMAAAVDALLASSEPSRPYETILPPPPPPAPVIIHRSGSGTLLIGLLLVAAAGFWFVRSRGGWRPSSSASVTRAAVPRDAGTAMAVAEPAVETPRAPVVEPPPIAAAPDQPGDAAPLVAPVSVDAGVAVAVALDAAVALAPTTAEPVPLIEPDDPEDDVEPDPAAADDPDPEGAAVAAGSDQDEEEAPDAPSKVPAAEPPPPPHVAPVLARSIGGAVRLARAGKRELALKSLRVMWPKHKQSAYIPFLIGNLYFDKRWWTVAMSHYRIAIKKNHAYRRNATLNRNLIRMLANAKTRKKANWFLRKTIGHPARPYLKWAAKHDRNPKVRVRCAGLLRAIR